MCDQGRYGFDRFAPERRLCEPLVRGVPAAWDEALAEATSILSGETVVFAAPDLATEEYALLKAFLDGALRDYRVVLPYRERILSEAEAVLISPDYAVNFRGAQFAGLVTDALQQHYEDALAAVRAGGCGSILVVGQQAVAQADLDGAFARGLERAGASVACLCQRDSLLAERCKVVFPGRSVLEKSGLMINRKWRLQYLERVLDFPAGSQAEWEFINRFAKHLGMELSRAQTERDLTLAYLGSEGRLKGIEFSRVRSTGVALAGSE